MKWTIAGAVLLIGLAVYFIGFSGSEEKTEPQVEVTTSEEAPVAEKVKPEKDPFLKEEEKEEPAPKKQSTSKPLERLDGEEAPNTMALTEEEMEELEEYFEKIEEEWGDQLKQLFQNELQLSKEIVEQYEDLREGFEEEKLAAFQEYHEQMVAKHGENYAYRPSEDEKIFEKKVLDEYYDRLRKLLGDEAYNRYTEVRGRFNERIKSEQDPAKGILVIDF